eukprot:1187298-Prorocentrum_minimum.AAC.1
MEGIKVTATLVFNTQGGSCKMRARTVAELKRLCGTSTHETREALSALIAIKFPGERTATKFKRRAFEGNVQPTMCRWAHTSSADSLGHRVVTQFSSPATTQAGFGPFASSTASSTAKCSTPRTSCALAQLELRCELGVESTSLFR